MGGAIDGGQHSGKSTHTVPYRHLAGGDRLFNDATTHGTAAESAGRSIALSDRLPLARVLPGGPTARRADDERETGGFLKPPGVGLGWVGSRPWRRSQKREKFGARICLNSGRRTYASPFRSVACFASLRITLLCDILRRMNDDRPSIFQT